MKKPVKKYRKGGEWLPDSKVQVNQTVPVGISKGSQIYQDWEHKPIPAKTVNNNYKKEVDTRSSEQKQQDIINQLNTYTPTQLRNNTKLAEERRNNLSWQDRIREEVNKQPFPVNVLGYPAIAAANLSEPDKYFKGRQGYQGFIGAGEMAMDIAALVPVAQTYGKAAINELKGTQRAINNFNQLNKRLAGTVPLSNNEANLLKNSRVIGSIYHSGVEESAKLNDILNKVKNLPDENLKNITGYTRAEIEQRLVQLQEEAGTKKTGSINLQRPSRTSLYDELGTYRERIRDIADRLPDPPDILNIDVRNIGNDFNSLYRTKSSPTLSERLYNQYEKRRMGKYTPQTSMPVTEALVPHLAKRTSNNPAAEMLKAYKKVEGAQSGQSFIPAHSLSEDSYPMSLKLIEKANREGIGKVNYHGYQPLNTMGFPAKASLPQELTVKEVNSYIDELNKGMSKPIPYAYIENGTVQVPTLTVTKKQFGGITVTQDMKKSTRYGNVLRPKMEKGGPILNQWDLPSSPDTPGYEDYGDMYTVPQWPGLMYKDPGMTKGWEGFGNPANLQQSSWDNTQQSSALSDQPKQQLAMDASDYSIDKLRSQNMKNGGFSQRKGYFWNGTRMQKAVPGAYDGTEQYQSGGAVIPKGFQQIPIHQEMGRYGLNLYQNGGMAKVPIQQHMGRYGLLLYKQGGSVPPTYTAYVNPSTKGMQYGGSMYAEGGIHIKPENKGKFGRWAANHDMGVQEAARHVMANKEDYSSTIVKRANFAKNAASFKHQYGGPMYAGGGNFQPGEYEDPSTMPATAPPPVVDPLAPDPNDPNDPRNLDPQYAQQNAASRTGVVTPPPDPALSAQWRAGMTDEEAQQNLNNRPTTQQYTASMVPPMKPKRPFGTGYRNLLGAAMMYGQYAANQRQQKNLQAFGVQNGMTGMNPTRTTFSRGTYNQQGQMMPNSAQYGGMQYKTGGIYEVDDHQLEMLRMGGYKFKMI